MLTKLQELRKSKKKGFTLVELIVVLVILAILIALLVPALTGYIDKAKEKSVAADARMMLEAVQTEESDAYAKSSKGGYAVKTDATPTAAMNTLAEQETSTYTSCKYNTNDKGKVTEMTYVKDGHTAKWTGTAWE
ncbi:MAG: type II secretion system protein [Anaerostipes sp.]|nr:type II secretion system protein [Anaerostipes sp.]